MKTLKQILNELRNDKQISFEDPIFKIFPESERNKYIHANEILEEFDEAFRNRDGDKVLDLIGVCLLDGVDKRYTKIFCDLLQEDWHEGHEDIVSMLEDIQDPASIDALYERALVIPNIDDMRALAIKCIYALGAINTPKAMEKLCLLKDGDDEIISQRASSMLNYYNNAKN